MTRPNRPVSTVRLAGRPTQRSALRRATQIAMALSGFLLWVAWHRGLMRCDTHRAADRFAEVLQRLGTTFVKLGQHLSLRADILAPDAQEALASLQANVAPFPPEQAVQEVEAALGRPWQQVFARFDMHALAAASIAQIHRAALPDGTEVVVKIRRPGAAEQAETDMRILRRIVLVMQGLVPSLRRWGLAAIVDEVAANFRYEMDLSREAASVRRFADAWRGSADIVIPDVVDGLCTPTVMVQQFSHGAHLHGLPSPTAVAAAGKLVTATSPRSSAMASSTATPIPATSS